jgi:hypothetical protein
MRKWLALSMAVAAVAVRADAGPGLPGWLTGCWSQADGDKWTEECWTAPRAGQMLGSGRSGAGERVSNFEFMRIENAATGLVFLAAPRGNGWTAFPAAADSEGGVTFLNLEHDYPQRIRYWREGELLHAETSLADGTEAERWTYRRANGGD